jgi:hypothetical protein
LTSVRAQVRARAEHLALGADHHHLDAVVGVGALEVPHQLGDQLARQRVAVVLRVERDRRDSLGDGVVDQLGGVGHGRHRTHP